MNVCNRSVIAVKITLIHSGYSCYEFSALVKDPALLGAVFPVDASCEDVEVDAEMSFLDAFVHNALQSGAKAYIPRAERGGVDELDELDGEDEGGWKFDQYAKPEIPVETFVEPAAAEDVPDAMLDDEGGEDAFEEPEEEPEASEPESEQ